MKFLKTLLRLNIILLALLTVLACSKDDTNDNPNPDNSELNESEGISVDDLDNYEGQIGLNISARALAIKGYKPKQATITVSETYNNIDETIELDEDLTLGRYSLEVEDLSEAAKGELESGVTVNIAIKDEGGMILQNQSFTNVVFRANPNEINVNANGMEDMLSNLSYRPGVKHYVQILNEDGASPLNSSMFVNWDSGTYLKPVQQRNNYDYSDTNPSKNKHQFELIPIPNSPGIFAITAKVNPSGNALFMKMHGVELFQDNSMHVETTDINTLPDINKFKISRTDDTNLYTITPISNNVTLRKDVSSGATRFVNTGDDNLPILYVRILTLDVEWAISSLDVKYLDPILPAPEPDFAFNTKYINCSQGPASDTKEVTHSETKVYTISTEESFSMTASVSLSSTTTVGVGAEATFFGAGATVSSEKSITAEIQTTIGTTSTQGASATDEEEITYSTTRHIVVNPGTATNVYDAYQVYRNIRVPYVQRYEIRGNYSGNAIGSSTMTGEEIAAQFIHSNINNGGIITEIGSNYIEITAKGIATIADVYQTLSRAEDAEPNCN